MASGKLADPELEAFFLAGEKGTYEGGPAHSLSPVAVVLTEDEHDEPGPGLTPEQIARRERFRRKVTLLVSALGVASGLAVTVRLVRAPEESPLRAPVGGVVASRSSPRPLLVLAPAPQVEEEPVLAPALEPAGTLPEVEAPNPSRAVAVRIETPGGIEAQSDSAPGARPAVPRQSRAVVEQGRSSGRKAAPPAEVAIERPPALLSAVRRVPAPAERRPDGYTPPTVSFPD